MTLETIAPLSDTPPSACPQSQPDRADNTAQETRSYTTTRDTIPEDDPGSASGDLYTALQHPAFPAFESIFDDRGLYGLGRAPEAGIGRWAGRMVTISVSPADEEHDPLIHRRVLELFSGRILDLKALVGTVFLKSPTKEAVVKAIAVFQHGTSDTPDSMEQLA